MSPNRTFSLFLDGWNMSAEEFYRLACPPGSKLSWFSYLGYSLGGLFCVLFGVSGGCFSLHVLLKRSQMRMIKYLLLLCLWDMALLVSSFAFYGMLVLVSDGRTVGAISIACLILYPIINVAMTGSLWTILLITYERYKAVAAPLQQRMREIEPIRWTVLGMLLAAIIVNIPTALETELTYCMEVATGKLKPRLRMSHLRRQEWYLLYYRVLVYLMINTAGPLLLIMMFSIKMLLHQKTAQQFRQRLQDMSKAKSRTEDTMNQRRATYLLMVIIVKFIICHTPPIVMNIAEFVDQQIIFGGIFEQISDVSNLLVLLHSSTNWLIYCRWNKKPKKSNGGDDGVVFNSVEMRRLKELCTAENAATVGYNLISKQQLATKQKKFQKCGSEPIEPSGYRVARRLRALIGMRATEKQTSLSALESGPYTGSWNLKKMSLHDQKTTIDNILGYKISIMIDQIVTDLAKAEGSRARVCWQLDESRASKCEYVNRKELRRTMRIKSEEQNGKDTVPLLTRIRSRSRKKPRSKRVSIVETSLSALAENVLTGF